MFSAVRLSSKCIFSKLLGFMLEEVFMMEDGVGRVREMLQGSRLAAILKVQGTALRSIGEFMHREGFVQLMPVVVSPVTDPLCHSVYDASVDYAGQRLSLTKSMIMHKQVAVSSPHLPRIYIISPNVRLEKEHMRSSGRHLLEFSQVDIEMREVRKDGFIALMERLLRRVVEDVKREREAELEMLGRRLEVPEIPFRRFESKEAGREHGEEYEAALSGSMRQPFWVMDHAREFYDREDPERKGYYHNYDLVYPGGFGEALSGGERDWEYDVLRRKMAERGQGEESFGPYLEMAKRGWLVPSAGGGLGVERLVRYLAGVKDIAEVSPFAKVPGERIVL